MNVLRSMAAIYKNNKDYESSLSFIEKAKNIDAIPKEIVRKLNCNKIIKAKRHKINTYTSAFKTDIFPDAIGLNFVLKTFLSNFLSTISFMMHPAVLISTDPRKKSIK